MQLSSSSAKALAKKGWFEVIKKSEPTLKRCPCICLQSFFFSSKSQLFFVITILSYILKRELTVPHGLSVVERGLWKLTVAPTALGALRLQKRNYLCCHHHSGHCRISFSHTALDGWSWVMPKGGERSVLQRHWLIPPPSHPPKLPFTELPPPALKLKVSLSCSCQFFKHTHTYTHWLLRGQVF